MLISSSPTLSFSHRAAFPPSSIYGQRHELVEMKEKRWTANRDTFRLRKKGRSRKNKKVTQGPFEAAKSSPLKPIFGDIFVKLSLSLWQRRPKEHLQKSLKHTSRRKPITFLCNRQPVCVCAEGHTVVKPVLLMHC